MKFLAPLVIAAILAIGGYAIYYEIKHPCIRTRAYPCQTTVCGYWMTMPDSQGNMHTTCTLWRTRDTTCYECVERKP